MSNSISFTSNSEAQTVALSQQIATFAKKGDCFALCGTLGMGKSVFARGFIQFLTAAEEVPSPTFTLLQMYDAKDFTIYHFDLYRLKSAEEIFEIGMEDALYDGVSLIEWPEKMGGYLPARAFKITIAPEGEGRKINISSTIEQLSRLQEFLNQ